jgi:glycine betaine/choline ABC-type transport system substrate-binding protein
LVRAQAFVLVLTVLSGCSKSPRIVVGSKNFTESVLLGEIVSQHIERKLGIQVDRKLNLGGTLLAHEAIKSGSIEIYPEYTGTALTAVLKRPPARDPAAVFEEIRRAYREQWHIEWLRPLGFNNTFAMVVRKEAGVSSLSEAAAGGKSWRLGAGYEFLTRPDGLPGLLQTYPLKIEGSPITMDLGLLYSALQNGKVDMVAANSTDGLLSVLPVTPLADDKRYFPPYECAVLVREDTLAKHTSLRQALEQLSGKFTEESMRRLNYAVDGEHRSLRDVAAEALKSVHLD